MEITDLTIKLIFLLLPGIFGTFVIEKLIYKEKLELKDYIVSVIMIGFMSYFSLLIVRKISSCVFKTKYTSVEFFKALLNIKTATINLKEVFYAIICSIFIGLISVTLINKGCIYWIFRKCRITNKSGQDVWAEIFDNNTKGINSYVYVVNKKENIVYGGWVKNYSKDSSSPELLLENVVVTKDTKRSKEQRRFHRLYLPIDKENMVIEIIKEEKENGNI